MSAPTDDAARHQAVMSEFDRIHGTLAQHGRQLDRITDQADRLTARFDQVGDKLDQVAAKADTILGLLRDR